MVQIVLLEEDVILEVLLQDQMYQLVEQYYLEGINPEAYFYYQMIPVLLLNLVAEAYLYEVETVLETVPVEYLEEYLVVVLVVVILAAVVLVELVEAVEI
jgi:hypothetical protein